jgi:hypothetical protein
VEGRERLISNQFKANKPEIIFVKEKKHIFYQENAEL